MCIHMCTFNVFHLQQIYLNVNVDGTGGIEIKH